MAKGRLKGVWYVLWPAPGAVVPTGTEGGLSDRDGYEAKRGSGDKTPVVERSVGGATQGGRPTARKVGVRSSDSGDIREGRVRGEGERSPVEWVRRERGERGDTAAAAKAASRRSNGVTFSGATLPGLFRRYVARLCCIQARQSSAASVTGEPNSGGGERGGGGEGERFQRTEAIEGAGEGDCEDRSNCFWALASRTHIS